MRHKKPSLAKAAFSILTTALVLVSGAWANGKGKAGPSAEASSDTNVVFSVLYSFGGKHRNLIYPAGPTVAQDRDANLYSTTGYGGAFNDGVVFRITRKGEPTVMHELSSYNGSSGLTLGTDGDFYGATVYGGNAPGYGTLFKITPRGKSTVLYDFTGQLYDAYPSAPPIHGADGSFYGTAAGDFNANGGIVYKITSSGTKSTLFQFDHTDGAAPVAPLMQGTDGNFYGTTNAGGNNGNCEDVGCGVVFKLTPSGTLTVLHDFKASDGFYPTAPVIEGSDGNFYGTVYEGGTNYDHGVAFKITTTGRFTVLHIFEGGADGEAPQTALVQATDGNFYGVTLGGGQSNMGTIYKITSEGTYSVIYSFDNATGAYPSAAPIQHTDGKLYGFAGEGGAFNYGTLYSLDLGLGPFASLVSPSGKIGKPIGILGQGFTGTTGVSFNGKAAQKFRAVSDTYLTAVVPSGAVTGFVTVATPGGKLKSSKKFQVVR
jgi:uncharacterized repeat protein (TIGR03803 family)